MSKPLEHADGNLLIHGVIFREQDAQAIGKNGSRPDSVAIIPIFR
jgi:hypothetical protein